MKMRERWGKIAVVLAIVLALANARCFSHCLVQPCSEGAASCHSHGKANAESCGRHHDLTAPEAISMVMADVALEPSIATLSIVTQSFVPVIDRADSSPPSAESVSTNPLRV